jgi:hypothetical protein
MSQTIPRLKLSGGQGDAQQRVTPGEVKWPAGVVIQISGSGPSGTTYADPKNDPAGKP